MGMLGWEAGTHAVVEVVFAGGHQVVGIWVGRDGLVFWDADEDEAGVVLTVFRPYPERDKSIPVEHSCSPDDSTALFQVVLGFYARC